MKGAMIRCVRCQGLKKIYKVNSGYSHINTGGIPVDCPMCLGSGFNRPLLNDMIKKNTKKKFSKIKQKDCTDADKARKNIEST